jgi:molybdopterin converting factor small subunit
VRVLLPSPLVSYTGGRREVEADGSSLADLFEDLDRSYPGIRFRVIDEQGAIRTHIKVFVNREIERSLARGLRRSDEVMVVAAISGG